ncbi:MAG: class I SAM-dependent methyltransferase [Ectothiorhodospiraceae bacterium]|jgi:SAM-dependent methyltransferase|nr:class I SAM-dependent methyltransferase [Ectothiorhodospiraceae bacterium]
MDRKTHWENIYRARPDEALSWFQPRPQVSLELIEHAAPERDAVLIDVGGGSARLVDLLLETGFSDLTVLDIVPTALDASRTRLGERADAVHWIEGDITHVALDRHYDIWHDRAVFHFLVDEAERAAYLLRLHEALKPGGQFVLACFTPDGPEQCSGLPVMRYTPCMLARLLGDEFAIREVVRETHVTPAGKPQSFIYSRFQRIS